MALCKAVAPFLRAAGAASEPFPFRLHRNRGGGAGYVGSHEGVWLTTSDEIAEYFIAQGQFASWMRNEPGHAQNVFNHERRGSTDRRR